MGLTFPDQSSCLSGLKKECSGMIRQPTASDEPSVSCFWFSVSRAVKWRDRGLAEHPDLFRQGRNVAKGINHCPPKVLNPAKYAK